jgi:death-on-curing protein
LIFDITEANIRSIHVELEAKFPLMQKGIEKEGLIQALIEKQNRDLFGTTNPYDDIYLKAAVLMEGLIRWHIFTDGNKRTGLMSTLIYLYGNQHYLAIPVDSVRFLIKVASTQENDETATNALIREIADWLHEDSATYVIEFLAKVSMYSTLPFLKVNLLNFFGFKKKAKKITDYWYAVDTGHTDYVLEAKETSQLIKEILDNIVIQVWRIFRTKKKKKTPKLNTEKF